MAGLAASPGAATPERVPTPTLSGGPFAIDPAADGNAAAATHQEQDGRAPQEDGRQGAAPNGEENTDGDHAGAPAPALDASGLAVAQANANANVLLDLMAYQRTFDGAYLRTALNELSYAVVILKLFQASFYYAGLASTVLALGLAVAAVQRGNLGRDNARRMRAGASAPHGATEEQRLHPQHDARRSSWWRASLAASFGRGSALPLVSGSRGASPQRRARRNTASTVASSAATEGNGACADGDPAPPPLAEVPLDARERIAQCSLHGVSHFKTAGNVVAWTVAGTFAVEVAILVLILTLH